MPGAMGNRLVVTDGLGATVKITTKSAGSVFTQPASGATASAVGALLCNVTAVVVPERALRVTRAPPGLFALASGGTGLDSPRGAGGR